MGVVLEYLEQWLFAAQSVALPASVKPPEVIASVGWTPAAWIGLLQLGAISLASWRGLKIWLDYTLAKQKIAEDRAATIDARGDAQNKLLTDRVAELERGREEDRTSFHRQLSEERQHCERELVDMRSELSTARADAREARIKADGMMRQLLALQAADERFLELEADKAPKAVEAAKRVGQMLRDANDTA